MCTDEEHSEELIEVYGLLCWQGYENDHGSFKKLMWYGIMMEFNCKATSTWFKCGREKETACTHRQLGEKGQERKAQVDCITWHGRKSDEAYICSDVKIWDSWDHYPMYASDTGGRNCEFFTERKKEEMDFMEAKDRRANKLRSTKDLMSNRGEKLEENLGRYRQVLRRPLAEWRIVRKTREKHYKTNTAECEHT